MTTPTAAEGKRFPCGEELGQAWQMFCGEHSQAGFVFYCKKCDKIASALAEKVSRLEAENERLREALARIGRVIQGGVLPSIEKMVQDALADSTKPSPPASPPEVIEAAKRWSGHSRNEFSYMFWKQDSQEARQAMVIDLELLANYAATLLAGEGGEIHQQPKGDVNGG